MARYRNEDDRDVYVRNDRFERERPWNYNDFYEQRERPATDFDRREFGRGRFGERANYERDEPRYTDYSRNYPQENARRAYDGRDAQGDARHYDRATRSRLRCRDIMTRDLAVATRDTPLREVAIMMREEDTGVIPVVDYGAGGNGHATSADNRLSGANYGRGKLLGLITDRDIVVRAVAEDKDCRSTRAEELMTTDVHTARPHDRVVDVIRKMGAKQVRRIPIVSESGNLRGIISMGDIAVETEADRELADALEEISQESSFWGRVFG